MTTGWKPWIPDSAGVPENGLSAGLNEFGTEVYVGRGMFAGQIAAGKLINQGTASYVAALYLEYGQMENVLTQGIEYYEKEENCTYKWIPSSKGEIVLNAIQYWSKGYTFYVGRTSAFNSIQVGKLPLNFANVMYFCHEGVGHEVDTYEVLVCEKENLAEKELKLKIRMLEDQIEFYKKACSKTFKF